LQILKERIRKDGRVLDGNILKVDTFLNHQLDISLLNEIGKAFYEAFKEREITKIITAETSGIAIAAISAQYFDVPVIFARKFDSVNMDANSYEGSVYSYTKKRDYKMRVPKHLMSSNDRYLLLDDFLANGEAIKGMKALIDDAGATLVGTGVVIEKSYQSGHAMLKEMGIEVVALAKIASMQGNTIVFKD